jgi:hypothetical protein
MRFSPSLLASAIVLSFSKTAHARVPQHKLNSASDEASKDGKSGISGVLGALLGKRQDSSDIDCTPDVELNILQAARSLDTQIFCNKWLNMPAAIQVTDITPIV